MNTRTIISTATNVLEMINQNLLANFSLGQPAELELPSLRSRAKAIVNENRVYTVTDLRVVNNNVLEE